MLEIVFSDSAAGSLKLAQNYGKGNYQSAVIGVIAASRNGETLTPEEIENAKREVQQKERIAFENAVPLGGSPKDVYGINLALSFGDISGDCLSEARLAALKRLCSIYPPDECEQTAGEWLRHAQTAMAELRGRICGGESVRVWHSASPDEACGFCWFLAQLSQWNVKAKVYAVKMPDWIKDTFSTCKTANTWGEVAVGEWHKYLSYQTEIPPEIITANAMHWRQLQTENAPLRAVVNGRLCSVPESFYDSFIRRELAAMDDEFSEAALIGRVIGRYQLGITDSYLALRVEEMIARGELIAVSAAPPDEVIYSKTLRKGAAIKSRQALY